MKLKYMPRNVFLSWIIRPFGQRERSGRDRKKEEHASDERRRIVVQRSGRKTT